LLLERLLMVGDYLIPTRTPFLGLCLQLLIALSEHHRALAKERHAKE